MTHSKPYILSFLKKYLHVLLVFVLGIIGVVINQFYGISWDEEFQREMGVNTYNYIFNNDQTLLYSPTKYYGVAIEFPLYVIEKITHTSSFHDVYYLRHLVTHCYFLIGGLFCFLLIEFLYKNKTLAYTALLLYILQPTIFCHSFFNSKDIPLIPTLMLVFYLIALSFHKQKLWLYMLLGISVGVLTNIRLVGFMFFAIIPFFLMVDLLFVQKSIKLKLKSLLFACIFIVFACLTLYATWPILWKTPIDTLKLAFANMSKFPWEGVVLVNGELVKSVDISWTYFFLYFGVTNPIIYIVLGLIGVLFLLFYFFTKIKLFFLDSILKNNAIYLFCFVAPITLVIYLDSIIYDTWRHLYFLYAPFILLIIFGLHKLSSFKIKIPAYVCLFATFIYILFFSIFNFPHQHVYYNYLVSHSPEYIRHHYEMDYWGTSYKQGIEYVLEHDSSKNITISVADWPGELNLKAFQLENRTVTILPEDSATYHITTYRTRLDDYDKFKDKHFHSIYVNNSMINTIFKVK